MAGGRKKLLGGWSWVLIGLFLLSWTIASWDLPLAQAQGVSILSEASEKRLGEQADKQVLQQFGYYSDPFLQDYINRVGQRIVQVAERRSISYHFKVVDDPKENAFALPGGYVYITRGMLAVLNSEAQLAGVLGHEIAHVTQRHGARRMTEALGYQVLSMALAVGGAVAGAGSPAQWAIVSQAIFTNILLGHGLEYELEADEKGLYYAWKAGYDAEEAGRFMRGLRQLERLRGAGYHGFGATHPETTLRILKIEELSGNLKPKGKDLEIGEDAYKGQLMGLVYGDRKDRQRIRIYSARPGDTLATISADVLHNPNRALDLALLNGIDEKDSLRPGQKIKIVIER